MKTVASGRRGAASSTNYIGMDIAALIGPIMGGLTAEAYGYGIMYRFQAVPYFICMVVLFACRKWVYDTEAKFAPRKAAGQLSTNASK